MANSTETKQAAEILKEIALNLQFIILNLIQVLTETTLYLSHFLRSSLNVLNFYNFFHKGNIYLLLDMFLIILLLHKYTCFISTLPWGLLLIYRNPTDFCILMLYPQQSCWNYNSNNLLIPLGFLCKQSYWLQTRAVSPKAFTGPVIRIWLKSRQYIDHKL